jgi:16S rRNA (guanine1207-N2)-methyltransferase
MSAQHSAYDEPRTFTAQLGDQTILIHSKPGMPYWDSVSPASRLLGEVVRPAPNARMLLVGCGHGALGVALARQAPAGEAVLFDINTIAVAMARQTIGANAIGNARVWPTISVLPERAASFDLALLETPNDRKLARRWLVEAYHALADGGELYLAGANDQGIRSIVADAAALFSNAVVLGYKRGQRVAHAQKSGEQPGDVGWAAMPGIAPGTWHEFVAELRGQTFRLRSLPGVFAYDRLDEGTRLLLETIAPPVGARVLDIGCGYGVVGLLAAKLGAAQVDLVDVNLLAVAAAAENIALNRVDGARAFASDGVPSGRAGWYDLVLTNPPYHIGKAVDYEIAHAFIARTRRALKPGGQFVLVANQFLRYDKLLRSAFERVACLAETRSYRVWQAYTGAIADCRL